MFRVYLALPMYHDAGQKILATNTDLSIGNDIDPEVISKNIEEADGLIIRMPVRVTREMLANKKRLKVIASAGAGVDNIDLEAATKQGIIVTHAPGLGGIPVSEHALALMLNLSRNILSFDQLVRRGKYDERLGINVNCLERKTIGIVGFGVIGSELARKCRLAFRMKVIAYDPFVKMPVKASVKQAAQLEELLISSDFISLHAKLTSETRHMFQYEHFKLMKRTAYFINTSRGALVNQQDLVQALQDGLIAGAGIDVFDPEPPLLDDPLLSLPNVILTPHVGGADEETLKNMSITVAKEVLAILNGEKPTFVANPEVLSG